MNKQLFREGDIRKQVLAAVDKVSVPVIETISPMGRNVLYETDKGNFELTNDGITVLRGMAFKDPIENAVLEIIKDGSLRTNQEAGDGTSTTVLFSRAFINKSIEFQEKGMTHKEISDMFNKVADKLVSRLKKIKKTVKDDKQLKEVATISAGGDKEIANKVIETINTAGLDGMVYLELYPRDEVVVEKQVGFRIPQGMMYQNLYTDPAKPQVAHREIPVIIFDKTIYYAEEAEHILRVAINQGFRNICIVAKDFLGDAPNTFIANHVQGTIGVVLAKISDDVALDDLATYLGGKVISESGGRRVDSITRDDFVIANTLTADPQKILFTAMSESRDLKARIKYLQEEVAKDKDNTKAKQRLASLTNGIVTLKIGGRTEREAREKVYRYEDAINATRAAKRDGYLVGGGVSIFAAMETKDYDSEEEVDTALTIATSSIKQIAKNSQIKPDWTKYKGDVGYNSESGEYENLLESGVVEPFKATEMALKNAVSVATILTSIGTYILNDYDDEKEEK